MLKYGKLPTNYLREEYLKNVLQPPPSVEVLRKIKQEAIKKYTERYRF